MSQPLNFAPWPAPAYIAASSPGMVHLCCRRHGAPYHIDPMQELLFGHLIISTYMRLPDVMAAQALGGLDAVHQAMRSAGPLCCALGDERMVVLQCQVPGVWSIRN